MITIKEEPNVKPLEHVDEFEPGSTFKYNGGYYLVIVGSDAEDDTPIAAVDLLTGDFIGKYKRSEPRLYPVDLVMHVVETGEG